MRDSSPRWKYPGQSELISRLSGMPLAGSTRSEWPISWLCAARFMIVTIGVPPRSRACRRPTFVSIARGWNLLSAVVGKLWTST